MADAETVGPGPRTRLIAITKGTYGESAENIIGYVARVSNPSNQTNFNTMPRLLAYCIKNQHWSIFETASMTIEISGVSRAIASQLLRHRSFTFQEFSQRYAEPTEYDHVSARRQAFGNRQSSVNDLDEAVVAQFNEIQTEVWNACKASYDEAIRMGVSREQARFLLPLSTCTTLYMTGNIRSWIHYLQLRGSASTQEEHRIIAEQASVIFGEQFPAIEQAMNGVDV